MTQQEERKQKLQREMEERSHRVAEEERLKKKK